MAYVLNDISKYKDAEPLAVGYKVIKDTGFSFHGDFDYGKDPVGKYYAVDGDLLMCENGLHFCRNLDDCDKWVDDIVFSKVFKVSAFEKIIEDKLLTKTAAKILRFDEELPYAEFCNITDLPGCDAETKTYCSESINASFYISNSEAVNNSYLLSHCKSVSYGKEMKYTFGSYASKTIYDGLGIAHSNNLYNCNGVSDAFNSRNSTGINSSVGLTFCSGTSHCLYCNACEGIVGSIFCYGVKGGYHLIFNKSVTEERFNKIKAKIKLFGYRPSVFNYCNNPCEMSDAVKNYIWDDMPVEFVEYVKSLPEFDTEIFTKITGVEV